MWPFKKKSVKKKGVFRCTLTWLAPNRDAAEHGLDVAHDDVIDSQQEYEVERIGDVQAFFVEE